jgi:hypothetical protein
LEITPRVIDRGQKHHFQKERNQPHKADKSKNCKFESLPGGCKNDRCTYVHLKRRRDRVDAPFTMARKKVNVVCEHCNKGHESSSC